MELLGVTNENNVDQDMLHMKFGIPPSRANLMVVGPLKKYTGIGVEATQPIDWRGNISEVLNQKSCGNCWSMSSTSVLADRFIIGKKIKGLKLQPAVLAQCLGPDIDPNVQINSGCNGGLPYDAGKFFEKYGVPAVENGCPDWSSICSGNCGSANDPLISCQAISQDCSKSVVYKAMPNSTTTLVSTGVEQTINSMKQALLAGPIVCTFFAPKTLLEPI